MGIEFVRGRGAKVSKIGDKLYLEIEDMDTGGPAELESDLVVLTVGQEQPESTSKLSEMLGVPIGDDGFFIDPNLKAVLDNKSELTGVFLAGCAQGPRGIRYSVADAKLAAANAAALVNGKLTKPSQVLFSGL